MKKIIAVLVCCFMVIGLVGCGGSEKEPLDLAKISNEDFMKGYKVLLKEDKDITIEKPKIFDHPADTTESGKAEIGEIYEIKNKDGQMCKLVISYYKKTKLLKSILFVISDDEEMPDFFIQCVDNAVRVISAKTWHTSSWDYKSVIEDKSLRYKINGVGYFIFSDDEPISDKIPWDGPESSCIIEFGNVEE